MGKTLIIAEKPSVASDIAKALGGFTKHDDYFESDHYVLSSAIGHLLEICPPEGFEAARGRWTFAHLPVIPPQFDLRPIEKSVSRLRLLEKLIKRKDVDSLINACDAGREGELIFRHIVRHAKAVQPIQRLWLQSMTPAAIREGFARLRSDPEMRPLADAAVCRSEADWLVGINGTRAMTAFNSKTGGFHKTTVGRVQTPTLAIVVEREQRIRNFVPRHYWEVHGTFDAAAGPYPGRWFDEQFTKDQAPANGEKDELRPERIWDATKAEAIRAKCLGKPGIVTEESKPTTQIAPMLYDLTSLQREANGRFGFSASTTLKLAQALYERHKALTYPRTDARALPEDYLGTVKTTLEALAQTPYAAFAGQILQQGWVRPNKRIFNNAKISDHFAIIPTPQPPKNLTDAEQKLYDLVTKRFLAVFFPAAEFLVTTRITRVEGEPFKSEGKVMVNAGWLAVYGKEAQTEDAPGLVPVAAGERVHTREVRVEACQTKPPPRFTEATLLSAMEGAGKLVNDEELREAMAEKGLGTPATRAAIIEGLIFEQYMNRLGRELQPTAKAFSLIALLQGLGIPELSKPELTGDWEFKLRQIERGQLKRPDFMEGIAEMTRNIVDRAKNHEHDTIPGDFGELKTPCPKCGGVIKETYKKFQCAKAGCDFALWKIVAGRQFEPAEIEELLAKKIVGPLAGFRSNKLGRPFSAVIRLTPEFKAEFDFGQNGKEHPNGEAAPAPDFSTQEPLGKCPKCGGRVFEDTAMYVCEHAVGPAKSCAFRSGKLILQQTVDRAQFTKLLTTGRTDLLTHFVSRKGRPFRAFLVVDKDGKVGFEFEQRAARAQSADAKEAKPRQPAAPIDFAGREPIGPCPLCGGRVFETATHYLCEQTQAASRRCKFKVSKVILQRPITPAEMVKLLSQRRTDLLTKFTSNKTGRAFSAYLVLGDDGKVGFDFPPREEPVA
jgi:DNA topoisomerase-3